MGSRPDGIEEILFISEAATHLIYIRNVAVSLFFVRKGMRYSQLMTYFLKSASYYIEETDS